MTSGVARGRPSGLWRLLLRAPITLYRLRLGRLLGHRFLLLTHRGRKTGVARQTVIEVARYDPARRESVVFSAWRGETDWFRNIQAQPALRVETGRDAYVPEQRVLTEAENERELAAYAARHPLIGRALFPRLFGVRLEATAVSLGQASRLFRGVAFRPRADGD